MKKEVKAVEDLSPQAQRGIYTIVARALLRKIRREEAEEATRRAATSQAADDPSEPS